MYKCELKLLRKTLKVNEGAVNWRALNSMLFGYVEIVYVARKRVYMYVDDFWKKCTIYWISCILTLIAKVMLGFR